MATKKSASVKLEPVRIGARIENVHIENVSAAANEHTRAAVEALAAAAGKNADAIAEIARALKGSPATMGTAIHVENV